MPGLVVADEGGSLLVDDVSTCLDCLAPDTETCPECGRGFCNKHMHELDKGGGEMVTWCGHCRWQRIKKEGS